MVSSVTSKQDGSGFLGPAIFFVEITCSSCSYLFFLVSWPNPEAHRSIDIPASCIGVHANLNGCSSVIDYVYPASCLKSAEVDSNFVGNLKDKW